MQAVPARIESHRVQWLNAEVTRFIDDRLAPKFAEFSRTPACPESAAFVLYGSRTRQQALNTSDFDVAVFLPSRLSFSERNDFTDRLRDFLRSEFSTLADHGVTGELSLVFLPIVAPAVRDEFPSLYASIATDGKALVDEKGHFEKWRKSLSAIMTTRRYARTGEGKAAKWTWNQR